MGGGGVPSGARPAGRHKVCPYEGRGRAMRPYTNNSAICTVFVAAPLRS